MAKHNPGDVLSCDWNPVIGCQRYSAGCAHCWYLDGIFPWQQRLGNIPTGVDPTASYAFPRRLSAESLKPKNGIVGVVQHGDLFYDAHPDTLIHRVLDLVDEVAPKKRVTPKYVLWTKRAARMAAILAERYPAGLPPYLAASISIEDKASLPRIDELKAFKGTKILVLEPLLEGLSLRGKLKGLSWVILGSETGTGARPLNHDWARRIRDEVKSAGIPFFIKQLGTSHKVQDRELDCVTWSEFPVGFVK